MASRSDHGLIMVGIESTLCKLGELDHSCSGVHGYQKAKQKIDVNVE